MSLYKIMDEHHAHKGNIIFVPFAHDTNMNSGVNVDSVGEKRLEMYLANACVALVSAKHYNRDCIVALVTNLTSTEIPERIRKILNDELVDIITVNYDRFRFANNYTWSLAFYKLCALSYILELGYENYCYFDTDVYVQCSLNAVWRECAQNIMLYDPGHGFNTKNYWIFCNEVNRFLESETIITHFGGEFFASKHADAEEFVKIADGIFKEMISRSFVTSKGDEFIISLVADRCKEKIRNSGAYIFRFWTGAGFRLVSTCYKYNRVILLHVPNEKERGMIRIFDNYIAKGIMPKDFKVWSILRLNRIDIFENAKLFVRRFLMGSVTVKPSPRKKATPNP